MQDRFAEPWPVAVDIVADNRPAHRRRMHAQLMGAAGNRLQRQPAKAIAAAAYFPVCDGFLTVRVRLLPPAALDIEPAERHVDYAFTLGRSAFDHGPVGFSDLAVLGRHRKATASLGLLFKHGKIGKTYWAVVEGGPAEDEGTIDMPLGRLNAERGWWQKPDPEGQTAVTNWKVCGRADGLAWLALEPVTGRTHQLRVHTSATGWPIVGDNIYGNGPRFGEPILHLHSREIVIRFRRTRIPCAW